MLQYGTEKFLRKLMFSCGEAFGIDVQLYFLKIK